MISLKDRKVTIAIALTCFIMQPAFSWYSNSLYNFLNPNCAKIVLQLGGFSAHQGEDQDIGITGLIGDRFTVTQHNDQNVLVGLGYYVDGPGYGMVNMMYGLNAFYLPHTEVKGNIIQEGMFTNLGYRYSVNNYPIYVAAKGQIFNDSNWYNVTFDLGLGANVISTSDVNERSLDGVTLPDHAFTGNTSAAFSATVGVGVKFNNVYRNVPVECGYRFFYLGKGDFSKTTDQLTSTLKTGDSYANALVCSVTV